MSQDLTMPNTLLRTSSTAALLAGFALALSSPASAQDQRQAATLPKASPVQNSEVDVPRIKYTDFTLPNGLRVLLHEDHSSPLVALELWYNAGSKYDPKGKSGLAHMFEHMLDESTSNLATGEYARIVQAAGGYYNAGTWNDFVQYRLQMPSNNLEMALWLEADRMANTAPPNVDRFNAEKNAVKNEYRDRFVTSAVGAGMGLVPEVLFPGNAYAIPVIGDMKELEPTTIDDLQLFRKTYYAPNNAVLVIAGDLNATAARRMVEKHFSPIPRGKAVTAPPAPAPLQGEKRVVLEHPSGVRQLWLVWQGVPTESPDRPSMIALSSIISQRLRRVLIDERRMVITVNPNTNQHFDLQKAGILQVAITPTATASASDIENVADSIVASIKANGVTETEVHRWAAGYRLQMLTSMQADSAKAGMLADATINTGRPLAYYDIVASAQRLRPAAIQAAARKYLTGNRLVLSIVPNGKLELISKPSLPYTNMTKK